MQRVTEARHPAAVAANLLHEFVHDRVGVHPLRDVGAGFVQQSAAEFSGAKHDAPAYQEPGGEGSWQ